MTEELDRLLSSATDLINAIKSAHRDTLGCALAVADVVEKTCEKVENKLKTYPDDETLRCAVAGLAAARDQARGQVVGAMNREVRRAKNATIH
ncbi:hypothetical protein [Caballeronia sp. LjRoot31]|uniref:hypothetical protein n=1 Tax=Caballeronia sp. LjRoot31 TaxID=3342324 RepID=UPI003ECE67B0